MKRVNVLGTNYGIRFASEKEDKRLEEFDGYIDVYSKLIVVENSRTGNIYDIAEHHKKVLRHEIVHAFLYESGLSENSSSPCCWAENEEMVDWLAIQGEKIHQAWEEAEALSNGEQVWISNKQ